LTLQHLAKWKKDATNALIKIIIPLWIILSVAVTVWSYKSTRVKVFWKNLYRSVFLPREGKGEKNLGLEDRFITVLNQE
jgi:hypothetical protein